ncbi:MAG: hypothetical protein MI784_11095, partial [Cytophagales bacterium]|nr:hypothetical protein [Cytophagales bacterium]
MIKIGRDQVPTVTVIKKGKGSKTLNKKSKKIAEYISTRINFNYIPAIRTDKEAMRVVDTVMSKELEKLEIDPDYKKALDTITKLQKPVLDNLSTKIFNSLTQLLPNINKVNVDVTESRRKMALRQEVEVMI